jgi:uncharacterized membrane protein YqjE
MPSADIAPLMATLGSAPRIVVEGLLHRLELASLELKDVRAHAATTAIVAGIAGAFALLGGMAANLAIAALVWAREDRGLILGLLAIGYLIGAAAFGWWSRNRLKSWQPLAETRDQIREDCSCLQRYLSAKSP